VIRANLSTRPFYNERAVNLWLAVIALAAALATAFNGNRVLHYAHSDTQLAVDASRDEAQARELRAAAVRLRASVDPKQLERVSDEAHRANDLIDARTFSWTELFNRFETTLPDDVRIASVRPRVDRKRGTVLAIAVLARDVKDVNQFLENMEATGAFTNALTTEDHYTDQGEYQALIEAGYNGAAAVKAATTAAPAGKGQGRR